MRHILLKPSPSRLAIWLSFLFIILGLVRYQPERTEPLISWDVTLYYYYLPAYLKYQDPGATGEWNELLREHNVTPPGEGEKLPGKMSLGLSYLYLPFYLMANVSAGLFGYPADGFSPPYDLALIIGGIVAFMIGIGFLRRILLQIFSEWVVALTLILLFIGTNLWVFTLWRGANPHVWIFSLMAILLWLTLRFQKTPRSGIIIWMGIIMGEIVLIRPSDLILVMVPFLIILFSKNGSASRSYFLQRIHYLVLFGLLPWIPQILHWKMMTGDWLFYSYGKEGFFWLDPKFVEGLFSFRKGWWVYSPVMVFLIPGFTVLFKQDKPLFNSLFWPLLIGFYITVSWWCWWYGGSFGLRPMIDWLPALAIPLAFGIQALLKWNRAIFLSISFLMVAHVLFTSDLYIRGILHFDSMTFRSMTLLYQNPHWTEEYKQSLCTPNYPKALNGDRDLDQCETP